MLTGQYLDPADFVRHLHTDRENRTCHWGFDPAHWRCYVHLDERVYTRPPEPAGPEPGSTGLSVKTAKNLLNSFKARFAAPPRERIEVRNAIYNCDVRFIESDSAECRLPTRLPTRSQPYDF
jgi:hypothetical protein